MLKVAVVGAGGVAVQKHLPAWSQMAPCAAPVAVCDVEGERARTVAARLGIDGAYDDVRDMLRAERPDIVDICTPPAMHAQVAIEAMEGGAHVLIEKPMAASTEECDRIVAAAEATGRTACVAHTDLFYPAFRKLQRLVKGGAIGEFKGMRVFLSTPAHCMTGKPDHWAHRLAGGALGETGPHAVYLTLAFINPVCQVDVHGMKLLHHFPWSPFEDYRIDLLGECAASSIALTYATDEWAAQVDVWGTGGIMHADLESQSVVRGRRKALTPRAVVGSSLAAAVQSTAGTLSAGVRRLTARHHTAHALLVREFCDSIRTGTRPPVTAQEGRESIRVMDLIVDALRASSTI